MSPSSHINGDQEKSSGRRARQSVRTGIPDVPVTLERPLYLQPEDGHQLPHIGTARVNIAATHDHPEGTDKDNWAHRHQNQSVLQQHCEFFDSDRDGVVWPLDTFRGFHTLGFNVFLCLLATFIINGNFSYPTVSGYLPDPFFRIYLDKIHKDKHGSDSGTYDNEGRFVPQKFEDIFAKYSDGKDYLTLKDAARLLKGQRLYADPIGTFGTFFEWLATYILLWPEDGKMKKEDIRRIYDGSLFYEIAAARKGSE